MEVWAENGNKHRESKKNLFVSDFMIFKYYISIILYIFIIYFICMIELKLF